MNARYAWAGRSELLHRRPGHGPDSIIAVLPPFEEANRMRALTATILRDLNARGFTTALPDLPGQGESERATDTLTLADWRSAFAAAAAALPGRVHGVAIRAGVLVDGDATLASRWHFAPQAGAGLLREMVRLTSADGMVAGNRVDGQLRTSLAAAVPTATPPLRTIRLESDTQPADRHVAAAPLWRRAEPDNDPALAALLAEDIAQWIAACAA